MGDGAIRTRRWTRVEYDRLIEAEILRPEDRIELLGGEMVVKEPQHRPHATAILLVVRALERVFGSGWTVQSQLCLATRRARRERAGGRPAALRTVLRSAS